MKLTENTLRRIVEEVMNEYQMEDSQYSLATDVVNAVMEYYTAEYSTEPTGISIPAFKYKVGEYCKKAGCTKPDLVEKSAMTRLKEKGYKFS